MIVLYNILFFIGIILFFPVIVPAVLLSEKRRKTVLQRLGIEPTTNNKQQTTNNKQPIWIHALSVGEVLSAVPLVEKLKTSFSSERIVFSASTRTGFEIATERLNALQVPVFFFPYDFILSVRHVANKINPGTVLITETDIWPNFLYEMEKRDIPVILVNARLSERSFRGYKRLSFFTTPLFQKFSKICTQSAEDARRFRLLGIPPESLTITGNIKFDQPYAEISETEIESLRKALNIGDDRKVILAGSTHKGEEDILADAFLRIRNQDKDTLMILVPRDPARGRSVSRIFKSADFSSVMMSELTESEEVQGEKDVIVIDRIGVLRKLYALAHVAFVGGSLVNLGGHNPLEPAALTKPILLGPHTSDFREISEMLLESRGAVRVKDAESFCNAAVAFLGNPLYAKETGKNACNVFYANKGAIERTLKVVSGEVRGKR